MSVPFSDDVLYCLRKQRLCGEIMFLFYESRCNDRSLSRLRGGVAGAAALRNALLDYSTVIAPSHKSNFAKARVVLLCL